MKEQWSSKLGFILASAGAAVGLGALWRFPYLTGTNGGGAFFFLFIVFTLLIGLPMLISEFVIGRGSKKEAASAYKALVPRGLWRWIGRFGVLGSFLLLTFYAVVGGWIMIYTILSIAGFILQNGGDYGELFGMITADPWLTLLGFALFIALNVVVLSFGIQKGIERANKYLMPLLFFFLIILIGRALTLEGAMEGVRFLLYPDFSQITTSGLLEALGHSFFSLAVGFSCMVTYSSYLGKAQNLPQSASFIAGMNIVISLLAGLAIFPIVFAFGLEPESGPGLLFIALPTVFSQMPLGGLFLSLFLLLFLFATLTSSFSLLEIIVSAFTQAKPYKRRNVSMVAGFALLIAGTPAALSSGVLAHIQWFDRSIFDLTDFVVSNLMLPIGCFAIALFVGFKMNRELIHEQYLLSTGRWSTSTYTLWHRLMQTLVPLTIGLVFILQFVL
ncbi:sodium-dependent transporter [Shouchella shacheensis]|uniref:sodium-dependent transporter n=1 Tax=Shouchella shacheensis TaxID=1649580 RepID=UPI00073FBE46|nr:sodium-dependent transporter [Shouchella shacheensis]